MRRRVLVIAISLTSCATLNPSRDLGWAAARRTKSSSSTTKRSAAAAAAGDTARAFYPGTLAVARREYADSFLIGLDGSTDARGAVVCDEQNMASDGWRYHFFAPATESFVLITRCGAKWGKPLRELRSRERDMLKRKIHEKFLDTHEALAALKKAKISVSPEDHLAGGKRPYTFKLFKLDDSNFPKRPLIWEIHLGQDTYVINAETGKVITGAGRQY